jgi:hypothetical protein
MVTTKEVLLVLLEGGTTRIGQPLQGADWRERWSEGVALGYVGLGLRPDGGGGIRPEVDPPSSDCGAQARQPPIANLKLEI